MRYLVYIGTSLLAACLLVLASMVDVDELGLQEQAMQERRDYVQRLTETSEVARDFYTQNPLGGGYVLRTAIR